MNLSINHKQGSQRINRRAMCWLLLVLVIVTAIRIRLVNMPLERDEGDFAYGGQMMLQGLSIYKNACTDALKLPGTCAAYALAMALFGQNIAAIHIAAISVTLATTIFVFFLTRRMCGDGAGVVSAAAYALLSISPPSFGLAAHATHFVMLPAVAGIFLLQNHNECSRPARCFFAGLFLGVALVMKQTGAVFGIFAAVWIVYREFSLAERNYGRLTLRLVWFAMGGLLPFALTCLLIAIAGDWPLFWLWTFKFVGAHSSVITFARGLQTAANEFAQLFLAAPALWALGIIGAAMLFVESSLRPWRFFISGFVLCSLIAVYPGWRGHYFIQSFPALGLLAGVAFRASWTLLARLKTSFPLPAIIFPIFFVAITSPLLQWCDVYFTLPPTQVSRAIYLTNPFPESVDIGRYLAAHCPPNGRIAILGSEPQIYFYSHRRAATSYISVYPLMEPQPYALAMQKEMIQQIENSNPDYVVFVHVPTSWLQYSDSNPYIFEWFQMYQRQHLRLVGLVEIPPDGPATYRWFEGSVAPVQTTAQLWLTIFKKR